MRLKMNKYNHRFNKKKLADNFTFIIVPGSTAKPVKLNFSKKAIASSLVLIALLAVGALLTTYKYYSSQADIRRVEEIKLENRNKELFTVQELHHSFCINKREKCGRPGLDSIIIIL
jgi:hypothetical protein